MKRPKGCIYPDCLKCPLPDCIYDELEIEDEAESAALDAEIRQERIEEKHRQNGTYQRYLYLKKYSQSENGKERKKAYERTKKAKERQKRYEQTTKARERQRTYYLRHRETILAKARARRREVIA